MVLLPYSLKLLALGTCHVHGVSAGLREEELIVYACMCSPLVTSSETVRRQKFNAVSKADKLLLLP